MRNELANDVPRVRGGPVVRSLFLVAGLFLFALGIVMLLESRLGLSPWDVLNQGVAEHTPLSFGMANVAIAVVVVVAAWRLGARIGPGTVANAILIGGFVDLLLHVDPIRDLSAAGLAVRPALLAAGIGLIGLATALYIGAGMGAGPRDSLMLALTARMRTRLGVVRTVLEAAVTGVGFALGGTVGVGTLAFAFGIGPAVEASFSLLGRSPLAVSGDVPSGRGHEPQEEAALVPEAQALGRQPGGSVTPCATDEVRTTTSCVHVS